MGGRDVTGESCLIELAGIEMSFAFGRGCVDVLRGVDLEVRAGGFYLISGRSGSGKTTLLLTLGLLERPTAGTYVFDGSATNDMTEDVLARLRSRSFGFVFQAFNLFSSWTAWENVCAPLEYASRGEREPGRRRAWELLDRFGLLDRAGHRPAELSGGEQQRVALARALLRRPKVVIADEPTGALDVATATEVATLLRSVAADGTTVIVASHDRTLFGRYADEHLEMHDGRVRRPAPTRRLAVDG